MKKRKGFAAVFLGGFIIGFGLIVPGISGGALALSMGLYQPIIEAAARPLSNWRGKLGLFAPLGIGAAVCILLCSRLLEYLFIQFALPIIYLFLGLAGGGLPQIFKRANFAGFRLSYLTGLVLSFGFTLSAVRLCSLFGGGAALRSGAGGLIIQGALVGAGLVIPGLSVSFLLISLGVYELLLAALARPELSVLVPLAVGFFPAVMLCSQSIARLLKVLPGYVLYAAVGFALGSFYLVFPGLPRTLGEMGICSFLFLAGVLISAYLAQERIQY